MMMKLIRAHGLGSKLIVTYIFLGVCTALLNLTVAHFVETHVETTTARRSEIAKRSLELSMLAGTASEEGFSAVLSGDRDERAKAHDRLESLSARAHDLELDPSLTDLERHVAVETERAVAKLLSTALLMFDEYDRLQIVKHTTYEAYDESIDQVAGCISDLARLTDAETRTEQAVAHAELTRCSLAVGILSTLLAAILGALLARRILKPILALHDATKSFATLQYHLGALQKSDDEIGELAASFEEMASAIHAHVDTVQREQQRLATVFASIDELLFVCDGDGKIVAANTAACRLLESTEEDLMSKHVSSLLGPSTTIDNAGPLPTGKRNADLMTSRGRYVPVRLSVSVLKDSGTGASVVVAQDLTVTRRFEDQLRQAQKLEAVGRLASGVAHEINTPVQFVTDNVKFVGEAASELKEVVIRFRALARAVVDGTATTDSAVAALNDAEAIGLEYSLENLPKALEGALDGLRRVTAIVRSMGEFTHPDSREMACIDLNHAIACAITIAASEHRYVADVITEFGDIPAVTCHAGETSQAFLNILVNGAHAVADAVRGTPLRGRIVVRSWRDGDDVVVSVSDTGGGIPEEIRDRIFDPFFTTKGVGKGTGQGLAIAHRVIAEKHGGSLTVESVIGEGSTFSIRLPIQGKAVVRDSAA